MTGKPARSAEHSALHALANRLVDERWYSGIAWKVEHDRIVIDEGACGNADHAFERPMNHDAIHRIYSMTKPIVSVAALMLIEQGRLRFDDPVERFVPGLGRAGVLATDGTCAGTMRPITVEDLLTHRAGLSYDFLPGCPVAALYREASVLADGSRGLDELVSLLADLPIASQPGERWLYSVSIDVLAAVVQSVSDSPLREVLKRLFFDPFGMVDTDFGVQSDSRYRLVDMFGLRELHEPAPIAVIDPQPQLEPLNVDESYPVDRASTFARGGHGLYSTIDDYRRFMQVLTDGTGPDGERYLSEAMVELMWCDRLLPAQKPIAIGARPLPGYGWGLAGRIMSELGEAMQLSSVGEGGWSGAASTYFWIDRRWRFNGIVMTQYLGSPLNLGPDLQTTAYGTLGAPWGRTTASD